MNKNKLRAEMKDIIFDNLPTEDSWFYEQSVELITDRILDLLGKYKEEEEAGNLKFEEFWKKIPSMRKTGKPQARRNWNKLSQKDQQLALDRVEAYYSSNDLQYTKHPERYLSYRVFEVEVETVAKGKTYYQMQEETAKMSKENRERHFNGYKFEGGLYYEI